MTSRWSHHAFWRAALLLGLGNVEIDRLVTWLATKWTLDILDRTSEASLLLDFITQEDQSARRQGRGATKIASFERREPARG